MITTATYKKVGKAKESGIDQMNQFSENCSFVFKGFDEEFIYFIIIAKLSEITDQEIKDLKEKTRFAYIRETKRSTYRAECKMYL